MGPKECQGCLLRDRKIKSISEKLEKLCKHFGLTNYMTEEPSHSAPLELASENYANCHESG
jgi:hypothetical protein